MDLIQYVNTNLKYEELMNAVLNNDDLKIRSIIWDMSKCIFNDLTEFYMVIRQIVQLYETERTYNEIYDNYRQKFYQNIILLSINCTQHENSKQYKFFQQNILSWSIYYLFMMVAVYQINPSISGILLAIYCKILITLSNKYHANLCNKELRHLQTLKVGL